MKNVFCMLLSIVSYAQVGIGTDNPLSTLDIHGDVRISNVPKLKTTNNVLVVDSDGVVSQVDISLISGGSGNNNCPILNTKQSTGYYLLFESNYSIPKPNTNIVVNNNQTIVSAGTWIENNTYKFSYSNNTGNPVQLKNLIVNFNGLICQY